MKPSERYRPALLSIPPALRWLMLSLWAAMMFVTLPASADVSLRVEARPIEAPINAFVTVTDAGGDPVTGLEAADFSVTVDGVPVPTEGVAFSLPPKGSDQKVSVVFAMDYSGSIQDTALDSMQNAVIAFISSMAVGDYAAIVKFNNSSATKASVIVPFTPLDGPSGTGTQALINGVLSDYPGQGTNLFDAIVLSAGQFTLGGVALPPGPKAIIAISDGGDNTSKADLNTALAAANDAGASIFTVGVGTVSTVGSQYLTQLALQTGGEFYLTPTPQEISDAYVTVSELLNNEYLLSFNSSITDCNTHTIAVS
nr:VWA domain-containing protein [Methylotetracoccus sp.]